MPETLKLVDVIWSPSATPVTVAGVNTKALGVTSSAVVIVKMPFTVPIVRATLTDDEALPEEVRRTQTISPLFTVPAVVV